MGGPNPNTMCSMAEIGKIDLKSINNGAHIELMRTVLERAEADGAVRETCAAQVDALRRAYVEENSAMRTSRKCLTTDKIAKADVERDKAYRGLKHIVRGLRLMPDGETADAADVLWQCLRDYGISVRMQLDTETGLVHHLCKRLRGKYAAEVDALGLGAYVGMLDDANGRLARLLELRTESRMTKVVGRTQLARAASDRAFRRLTSMVNAQAMVTGGTELDNFIAFANTELLHYKREVLGRRAKAPVPDGGTMTGEAAAVVASATATTAEPHAVGADGNVPEGSGSAPGISGPCSV